MVIAIIVLLDDGCILDDVAMRLEAAGMTNVNVLSSVWVICGYVDELAVDLLWLVDGVVAVEKARGRA